MTTESESPFYALLGDAKQYTLIVEVDADSEEPVFSPDGSLTWSSTSLTLEADIKAASLGGERYRVCEHDLFGVGNLFWGDEFFASCERENRLRLKKILVPQKFRHLSMVIAEPMDIDGELSKLIHKLGGGWESFAGGLLTITIPAENWELFEANMDAAPAGR